MQDESQCSMCKKKYSKYLKSRFTRGFKSYVHSFLVAFFRSLPLSLACSLLFANRCTRKPLFKHYQTTRMRFAQPTCIINMANVCMYHYNRLCILRARYFVICTFSLSSVFIFDSFVPMFLFLFLFVLSMGSISLLCAAT